MRISPETVRGTEVTEGVRGGHGQEGPTDCDPGLSHCRAGVNITLAL